MLIEKYNLEIFTPPCGWLTVDISEVLPCLNATLRSAVYHPAVNALNFSLSWLCNS